METSDFVSEPGYASELSNSLYQLQQSGHLIDTFIKTKSGGINAHKVVLFANGGPFLQEQISRTVSLDTTMCNIDLSHVPHEDVLALVIYLYTGKLKLSCIQSDSCLKLFQFLEINLEKLKGNSSAECIKEEGSFEHVDDGLESENNSKSGDISDKMDSSETIDSLIPSSEKSDSGDSDNEPFEMEISNMQEVEVAADSGDNVCQAEIIHEKTGKLIKLGNVKIKPPGVKSKKKTPSAKKRKKKMTPSTEETKKETVPSTEKRKKALVHSANKRTKTSQLIENKKKGTVLSVKKQKKGKLESSEKVKELQEGTICSECSLDVHECVCEFATDIDTVTCTRCQIRYTTKEDFVKHREEKHSLRCGMCDFKITRGSNLVSHMLEKHGISSRQLETGLVKQEETTDQQNDDESPVSTETTEIPDTMEMDTTNEKQQGIFMKIHKMSDNDHHYSEADSSTQEDTNSLFGKISSDDKEANVNTVIYKETEADNDKTFDKDPVNADKGKLTSMESENHVNEKSDPGLKIEFPCEYCNQILRSEEALYIHLRDHNEKQCANEFLCNHCGKIYHSKKGLSRHMRCHTKNMFKCSFCDKEFYENTDLTSHIRSVHTGEFPFICSYCEKKFAGKKQYRAHLKIHDGTQLKYNCNYCDKVYCKKQHLEGHINTHHLKIRPFSCHFCLKTFADKSNLNKHLSRCTFEKNMKILNDQ